MQNIQSAGLMIGKFLFAVGAAVAGEPLVVNLWPGETPGDIGIAGEEKTRIFESPIVGPTKLVANVSKPTLMTLACARTDDCRRAGRNYA
jgi:hypothetical protein